MHSFRSKDLEEPHENQAGYFIPGTGKGCFDFTLILLLIGKRVHVMT